MGAGDVITPGSHDKLQISTSEPLATKVGKMVTYLDGLLLVKSTPLFKIARLREKLKPPYLDTISEFLCTPNLTG